MSTTRSIARKAPATEPAWREASLLLCAHGSRGGPGSAHRHATALARRQWFRAAAACCLNGRPDLAGALARLPDGPVFLVPFLMAEGYALGTLLPRALGALGAAGARVRLCPPVGAHPRLAEVIADRAAAVCRSRGWRTAETDLLIVGHGSARFAGSGDTARTHAARIAAAGRFAEVTAAFLEEAPRAADVLGARRAARSVTVGLFADGGVHGEADVRALVAGSGGRAVYAGPIGPDPRLSGIVVDQVANAAEKSAA